MEEHLEPKTPLRISASYTLFFIFLLFPIATFAVMPTNPISDPAFSVLPDGRDLSKIKVSGASLSLSKGAGQPFTASAQANYQALLSASQANIDHPVQWALMDLDSGQVLKQSAAANRKIFGASVAKVFTAATLVDKQGGTLMPSQMQLFADMLVVSSNSAWTELQRQAGGGDSDQGRAAIEAFTQRMGYARTHGFQGYWGSLHGNELTAAELARFLYDTYHARYPGAETVWKTMHFCRTGISRGRKYLPDSLYVGGKTGTYDGPTQDPETGLTVNPDGSPYKVKVRNHVLVFNKGGREYALAILANTGSDESAATLAGGIFNEL